MNLALFDFDGTITFKDTFTPFIYFAVPSVRIALGSVLLSPMILGYKIGWIPATKMRASIVRFGFQGRPEAAVRALGAHYGIGTVPSAVRSEALERIRWHQAQGDTVVVVSASLDVYLRGWCESLGLHLICTELESKGGVLTGRYAGGDCTGPEKSRRVRARYDLQRYPTIYAYGDTHEDRDLLQLANIRYFRGRQEREA